MRKLLLLLFFYTPHLISGQRNYSAAEISRLADLGKIWGILHNFHPSMARGIISTDSLVSDVAASLANDPSAANFKACLEKMFARLNDRLTHVVSPDKNTIVKLLTDNDSVPSRRLLNDSILYVAFPTSLGSRDTIKRIDWLQQNQLWKYKGLVLDLRNTIEVYDDDYPFRQNFGDSVLKNIITGPLSMAPAVYRYQSGFIDQAYSLIGGNIYSAGWQTIATDRYSAPKKNVSQREGIVVVVNKYISGQLMQYLVALRSAGYCKIVFDGDAADYLPDAAIDYITKADSLHLRIRVLDYVDINGNILREPDLLVNGIDDKNAFMLKCRALALASNEKTPNVSSLEYIHPFPKDTSVAFASVGERLFGLFNYWNAINYFNPNKQLLKQSWDSILTEFIPRFIKANDTADYYFTITDLVSHIHDSHGFFGRLPDMKTVTENYSYTVPLSVNRIQDKYYIVGIGKDSTQQLNAFQTWDEIIAIDSVPVNTYKQRFRSRFACSNDWTFERDLCSYFLLTGKKNSSTQLTIKRNGHTIKLNGVRTAFRYMPDHKQVSFNDDHKDIELLKGNIGYVNMGSLSRNRVDKIFDTLMQTKAIIFDIRNYPQGTAWNIVPRLTDHDSVAVKFGQPYVTYQSINSPLIFKTSEYFIVNADKTRPWYKGKIIILCDEGTQSQAEYTIMMFQGAAGKRVTVIGSATAGADGNVTAVRLPGGYTTYFSGLEVLYPDGSQTQRTGIRINIKIEPTVDALKRGKDEVLQRAIQFVESGK